MWPAIIIGAIVIVILALCIRIVPQANEWIVEFLGKYQTTWTAGLHLKIPVLQRISNKVILKEQVLDSPPQPVITKDNVTMRIDTVVYYRIFNSKLYTYGVLDPIQALENLTATTLRNIVGEMELDGTLTSRDTINGKMTAILDEATDQWGIKVGRVELKNIIPPAEIQNAMEKQMKAERDRRETLLQAEGHKAAAITRAEGDKQAMVLAAEGERDARIARAEGEAKAILLKKQAEADGLRALKEAAPDMAVLELKKYEALVSMADGKASKIIVPTDAVLAVKANVLFSETTGLGSVTEPAPEEPAPVKEDPCCERFEQTEEE
ncbi:MAG: SPFH/Band 7/PHB domain protein [Lachnospiraceae bacterium]|nr:SPFH/Band 7/PHB domain protein [Candidatus Minthocola equi]